MQAIVEARERFSQQQNMALPRREFDDQEPLLIESKDLTFGTAVDLLVQAAMGLPVDLAERIVQFLVIERVNPDHVTVMDCSSHDGAYQLRECLTSDENTWWLSEFGSMPRGRGREWLEFEMGTTYRRFSTVYMKIPPLPMGPLSVAEFQVEVFDTDLDWWSPCSPIYRVESRAGWQQFDLPESRDCRYVRLLFLSNQISHIIDAEDERRAGRLDHFSIVGLFSLAFG